MLVSWTISITVILYILPNFCSDNLLGDWHFIHLFILIFTVTFWSSDYYSFHFSKETDQSLCVRFESSSCYLQSGWSCCYLGLCIFLTPKWQRWDVFTKSKAWLFCELCKQALRVTSKVEASQPPVFGSLFPSFPDISADGLGDTCAGIATEMDLWVSSWEGEKNLLAGFIFLGWFIWQGPILHLILEFQNLFISKGLS